MDHRQLSGGRVRSHGGAPYRARLGLPTLALTLLTLLAPAWAAPAPVRLKASGASKRFELKVVGGAVVFEFSAVAGCRYRLTVLPRTLARPVLEVGRAGEEPLARVDSDVGGAPVVHVWDAERDAVMHARVSGFSAQVGEGRITLETLDADGRKTKAHRRYLEVTGERARVGELLVGEPNRWELVVEEGAGYEITPTRGSAGRVRLLVLDWDGKPLADSAAGAVGWLAYPPVRFRVPPKAAAAAPDGSAPKPAKRPAGRRVMRLEVRSLLDGGGTYGVRLRALGPDQDVEPVHVMPPETVERGPVAGEPHTFRAGPGDVAFLYVPLSPQRTQIVQMKRGERWIQVEELGLGGSARSQEDALMTWFQPYYPGTYRFVSVPGPPPSTPTLLLHDRAALGSAPIHMGTGVDPTVRARLASGWRLVGLGVCMPGWDYIFVCVHGPDMGVAMRVVAADGKVVRNRAASDRTISPGLGPSLRFRVPRPGVYRLEARNARKRVVRPLLRRAAN